VYRDAIPLGDFRFIQILFHQNLLSYAQYEVMHIYHDAHHDICSRLNSSQFTRINLGPTRFAPGRFPARKSALRWLTDMFIRSESCLMLIHFSSLSFVITYNIGTCRTKGNPIYCYRAVSGDKALVIYGMEEKII